MAEVEGKAQYGGTGQKDKEGGEAKKKGYNFNEGHRVASKKFEGKCGEVNRAILDCSDTKQAESRLQGSEQDFGHGLHAYMRPRTFRQVHRGYQ
jgi:hypothetical protein